MRIATWRLTGPALTVLLVCGFAGAADRSEQDAVAVAAQVDRLVAARWKERDVPPAAAASDAEFLRRAYLDLVGHIPPITEVRDFLDDRNPDKRRKLVSTLLASERHAAHAATTWAEIIVPPRPGQPFRNGDPFANWLRQHFVKQVGFDRIARELIAGGTDVGPALFNQLNEQKPENLAANVSRVFLGIGLQCAECHDHPCKKWKREQFWNLAAFFNGELRAAMIPGTTRTVPAKVLDGREPTQVAGATPRAALAAWVIAPENPYFARAVVNRVWEYLLGTGLVDPVDDLDDENPPSHPEVLDLLAKEFVKHGHDLRFLTRVIVLSRPYQLTSRQSHAGQADPRLFARMAVRGLSPEQLFDSLAEAVGPDVARQSTAALLAARNDFLNRFPNQERRTESQTSILQALYLMNGRLTTDATTLRTNPSLAVIADADTATARKVDELFMVALARRATVAERTRLVAYVERTGPDGDAKAALADIFWALLNGSEFHLNH